MLWPDPVMTSGVIDFNNETKVVQAIPAAYKWFATMDHDQQQCLIVGVGLSDLQIINSVTHNGFYRQQLESPYQ